MDLASLNLIADAHIRAALEEDLNHGDVSAAAVVPDGAQATVDLIAKQEGVIAGLDVFEHTFRVLDPAVEVERFVNDGDRIEPGHLLARISGSAYVLLAAERTALNYLQRMSGIATYTRQIVELLEGSKTSLVDTRKTTPGMRIFEKDAVRIGGGVNHRYTLSESVMLKDNHIAAAGGILPAVRAARATASFTSMIEVETEDLAMVAEALEAGADIIMLDNMDYETMSTAIALIDGKALTECSGNVTKDNVEKMADLGVDFISSGALTHSAGILDLSMKNLRIER